MGKDNKYLFFVSIKCIYSCHFAEQINKNRYVIFDFAYFVSLNICTEEIVVNLLYHKGAVVLVRDIAYTKLLRHSLIVKAYTSARRTLHQVCADFEVA